eukprot:TRINITY_DN59187_c0_g1_i1.p1 TRINITY_DN59187_c0_g1~~TRINITY_DN59187_c0_g1_i1.p1  ORF type:complete len:539 (+),score=44.72 TRINITY_DN59187_c0_g1_i1:33-1649(+)
MAAILPRGSIERKLEAAKRVVNVNKSIVVSLIASIFDQFCDWNVIVILIWNQEWQLALVQWLILMYAARITAYRTYVQPLRTVQQNKEREDAERRQVEYQERLAIAQKRKAERVERKRLKGEFSSSVQPSEIGERLDAESDSEIESDLEAMLEKEEAEQRAVAASKRTWAASRMKITHPKYVLLSLVEVEKFRIGCLILSTAAEERHVTVDSWVVFANTIFSRAMFCTAPQLFAQLYVTLSFLHRHEPDPIQFTMLLLSLITSWAGFILGMFTYECVQVQADGLRQFPSIASRFLLWFAMARGMEFLHRGFSLVLFLFFFPVFWVSILITLIEELLLVRYLYKGFVRITCGWMHSMKPQDPALPSYTPTWPESLKILHRASFAMYPMYTVVHAQRYFEACLPIGPVFPLMHYNTLRFTGALLKSVLLALVHFLDCRSSCAATDFNILCGGLYGFRFGLNHTIVEEAECARLTGTLFHPVNDADMHLKFAFIMLAIWVPFVWWKFSYYFMYQRVNSWHAKYISNDSHLIKVKDAWGLND